MPKILKDLGKEIGPGRRLLFAMTGLFAPSLLLISVAKAFLNLVESLDDKELKKLIKELQDV